MKILLLNSEFPPIGGGAGNASANIARHLVAGGHEVVVITVRHANLPHEENWLGVRIVRVPALRKRMDRSGLLEQISYILVGSMWAGRVIKTFSAQVVLAFFGVPAGPIAWLMRKLHGIPYMISMRGGDVPGFRPYDFGTYHRLVALGWSSGKAVLGMQVISLMLGCLAFIVLTRPPLIANGIFIAIITLAVIALVFLDDRKRWA